MSPLVPALAAPAWITYRGGDCRAYDRRLGREVFGPSHDYARTTDAVLTNGITRLWPGPAGLPAFATVETVLDGAWIHVGCIQFGGANHIGKARLAKVTPEATTIALAVRDAGEVFLTLRQGQRHIEWTGPSSATVPRWKGTPPAARIVTAGNAPGRFDNGLDGGGDDAAWSDELATWADPTFEWDGSRPAPDLVLRWSKDPAEWSTALWLRPDQSSADSDGAGYLTVLDSDALPVAELYLEADGSLTFAMDTNTVSTAPLDFDAGDDLFVALRFSTTHGMALTVRHPDGALSTVTDAAATDPNTETRLAFVAYVYGPDRFGDGDFGDGIFGGDVAHTNAVVDNHQLFADWLTDEEVAALAAATERLDGLPFPESRLVWYAPYDPAPIVDLVGSGGLLSETSADPSGLARGIAYVDTAQTSGGALIGTTVPGDDLEAQYARLVVDTEQKVRVR